MLSIEFHPCSKHLLMILGVVHTMMMFSTKIVHASFDAMA